MLNFYAVLILLFTGLFLRYPESLNRIKLLPSWEHSGTVLENEYSQVPSCAFVKRMGSGAIASKPGGNDPAVNGETDERE